MNGNTKLTMKTEWLGLKLSASFNNLKLLITESDFTTWFKSNCIDVDKDIYSVRVVDITEDITLMNIIALTFDENTQSEAEWSEHTYYKRLEV